jgi:hypothetical protein
MKQVYKVSAVLAMLLCSPFSNARQTAAQSTRILLRLTGSSCTFRSVK